MALNISDYLTPLSSSWNSLRDYVISRINSFDDEEINNIINLKNFEGKPLFKEKEIAQLNSIKNDGINNKTEDELDEIAYFFFRKIGLVELSQNNKETDIYKTWWKKIRTYKNNEKNSRGGFQRSTLYPLLFVLRIDTADEILYFCRDILHQQELSAHSLEDFLVMSALKLKLSYADYIELRKNFQKEIDQQVFTSPRMNFHMTADNLDAIDLINSTEDLRSYISTNSASFALQRNTPYNMLFPCVSWLAWQKAEWTHFFSIFKEDAPLGYETYSDDDWLRYANDDFGISADLMKKLVYFTCDATIVLDPLADLDEIEHLIITKYHDYDRKKFKTHYDIIEKYRKLCIDESKIRVTMKDYYLNIFSLCKNGLTEDQIKILSNDKQLFGSAFIDYSEYQNLYLRKCANTKTTTESITQGVYLLSLIHYYPVFGYKFGDDDDLSDYLPEEDIYDLFTTNSSIDEQFRCINGMLSHGGFPSLNEHDPFNKLFMDTYREVLEDNSSSDLTPKEIKEIFLSRLCSYLKQIAKELELNELKL